MSEIAMSRDRVMLGKAAVEGRCGCSSSGEGPLGAMDLAGAVPGVEFARRRCHEHCVEYLVCPTCSTLTHVQTVSGRWDEVERRTARPFDPVAVTLFCGHVFGDLALARPGVAAREAE